MESILIYRVAAANSKVPDAWDKVKKMEPGLTDTSVKVKFPYSTLIAGFGALLGLMGCVSSANMYGKSLISAQQGRVLSVFPATPPTGYKILQET